MRDADEPTGRPEPSQASELPRADRVRRTGRLRAVLGGALARLIEYVVSWRDCARSRQHFASVDDRMLRDIGIDRDMVEDDSTSSFWRLR
jgi:uncharacterized protein YjiS (DUF1127 family)